MIYIQIPEKHDAEGFLALATSGISVLCLPENTYGVSKDHIELLKRKEVPFKKLKRSEIPIPRPAPPHYEEIRNLLTAEVQRRQKNRI
jgi:hypothetical protein